MKRIQIYTACVDCLKDPGFYQKTLRILPSSRKEAADRMKIESGKRLSAGAGLLLMASLAEYLKNDIKAYESFHMLRIGQGPQKKPFLVDHPEVHFNLSHSGNRVMCAVGPVEVGCDVEVINPAHVKSVVRCLAESEQKLVEGSPLNFFRLWTLKESIMKLSGKGFLIPFNSFEVSLDPLSVRQDFLPEPVSLGEYPDPGSGSEEKYCFSCAAVDSVLPETMITIELEELLMSDL